MFKRQISNNSITNNKFPKIEEKLHEKIEYTIDPNILIDSNLFITNIKGNCTIKLHALLTHIINAHNDEIKIESLNSKIDIQRIKIKKYNNQFITMIIPFDNYKKYFQPSVFLANYLFAFNNDFPAEASFINFKSISLKFDLNNIVSNNVSNLNNINKVYFKILTCLFFGFLFDIKLSNDCACYPQTLSEFIIFKSNISFNCIKLDCKERLIQNPLEIDYYNYSDCNNLDLQFYNINSKLISSNINYQINLNNFYTNLNKHVKNN